MIGACIGAGVLGIPYVAAKAGFFVALAYIIIIGALMLLINLYLGEVILRTKAKHHLKGYAEKYLGKRGGILMEFAFLFIIYSAITAYILGIGESIGFLILGDSSFTILFGLGVSLIMSGLLWGGLRSLKKFEKIGILVIFSLLILIFILFIPQVNYTNLTSFNSPYFFMPFGVILFALASFAAIPEVNLILGNDKKYFKNVLIFSTIVVMIFYILFTFVIIGFKGTETPQISTLALGPIFILLGIFTMLTSYLALGNAAMDNFRYDERFSKTKAWAFSAIIPIFIFLFTRLFDFFSFTKILAIGGVISGGLVGILSLFMVHSAKKNGEKKPAYKVPINWIIIIVLSLVFIGGIFVELVL